MYKFYKSIHGLTITNALKAYAVSFKYKSPRG